MRPMRVTESLLKSWHLHLGMFKLRKTTNYMGGYRSKQIKLRNTLFQVDFGKCVLDVLFSGWYSIHFYKPDATREEILAKRLSVLNKELLYLNEQLDEKSTSPPRDDDFRSYWDKIKDASELKKRKDILIEKLKEIRKNKRNQKPST